MSSSRKRRHESVGMSALSKPFNNDLPSARQNKRRLSMSHASSSESSLYMDNGDCGCVCEYCNAFFWYEERCISLSEKRKRPIYTQCCKEGRVKLPYRRTYSSTIVSLFNRSDFMANIRAYNSMFSMTSFGAKVDESINDGSAPYVFKIEGQIHHWLGSLCPADNERPRFLQMYVYDTDNELCNRLHCFQNNHQCQLSEDIVSFLIKELEECNELVKLFHTARDVIQSNAMSHPQDPPTGS